MEENLYMYKTKNRSFVDTVEVLRQKGYKNYLDPLLVYDKDLINFDTDLIREHKLTRDERIHWSEKIKNECKQNPWYFFREIVKISPSANPLTAKYISNSFVLIPRLAEIIYCYIHDISVITMNASLFDKGYQTLMHLLGIYDSIIHENEQQNKKSHNYVISTDHKFIGNPQFYNLINVKYNNFLSAFGLNPLQNFNFIESIDAFTSLFRYEKKTDISKCFIYCYGNTNVRIDDFLPMLNNGIKKPFSDNFIPLFINIEAPNKETFGSSKYDIYQLFHYQTLDLKYVFYSDNDDEKRSRIFVFD